MKPRSTIFSRKCLLLLSCLCAAYISSCASPPNLSHKECIPPPPPDCRPGLSTKIGIDTAHIQPGDYKYHIDLLPGSINSNGNENAITYFKRNGSEESILSAEREGDDGGMKQRILTSKLLTDLHFEKSTEIKGPSFEDAGAAAYCNADQHLYFTAKAPNEDPNDFDLYSAKLESAGSGYELVETQPLAELNKTVSFDGQPAISPDGLMIVFASDRAGGSGGVDLWYSSRSSVAGQWGEPHPLPKEINTPCDELSPSFSADGKKLFFSSDGHETIGGYDIFSSELRGDSWSAAENLGTPINTRFDEIFPYQLSDSQFFYTSDQPVEFKGRNIFVLRRTYVGSGILSQRRIEAKNIPDSIQLKGSVELPPDSILPEVFVRDVQKDKEIARKPTDTAGRYSFRVEKGREYDVGSEIKDKFYDVHRVDLRKPADSVIVVPHLSIPDTLILRINFPFDDDSHPYDYTIGEKGEKTEMRWQTSLDLLAKSIRNSSLNLQSVILYGHTDSLGTDEYNFDLAKRRANFIARQLRSRGISSKLLTIVSKGRTMPVARTPGESDETFQLRCRRVEFVKVFKKDNMR